MDQNHTRIPHLGTQNALSETINQGIIGVKEHGSKVKFYRSLDTAPKGADLTIYCILRQIESWRDRHGYFPEEIYLQLDGGSENANQYVLAMLELLVAKNITKVIHYTRLPTGHTHEDIDSCFGVLWRVLRGKCCETLSKYKEMVENAFKADGLKAEVEDVLIVPNYIQLFEGCIDEKFGRAHKLLQTQHQWRFEAVPCSQYFPLGVKATYRSYSSDRVVEFVEKPKMECMSNIGQLIGLEPIITYVRWYPTENCNPDRPLEGIFLLHRMPSWGSSDFPILADDDINCIFPPREYQISVPDKMRKAANEAANHFSNDTGRVVSTEWKNWETTYLPKSNEKAIDYVKRMYSSGNANVYRVPLQNILFSASVILDRNAWSNNEIAGSSSNLYASYAHPIHHNNSSSSSTAHATSNNIDSNHDNHQQSFFDFWSEIHVYAASTNSVQTWFNPNPPEPRQYFFTKVPIVEAATKKFLGKATEAYYDGDGCYLSTMTKPLLQKLYMSKVRFDGLQKSLAGSSKWINNNNSLISRSFLFYYYFIRL